jgi:cyclic beta-1,2-glucan synthetase
MEQLSGLSQELPSRCAGERDQYNHAAIWSVIAYVKLSEGNQAAELLRMLNPINRTTMCDGVQTLISNR